MIGTYKQDPEIEKYPIIEVSQNFIDGIVEMFNLKEKEFGWTLLQTIDSKGNKYYTYRGYRMKPN